MPNIVGIDLGTNSLGINLWDKYDNGVLMNQIESSVDVFSNGVSKGSSTTRESSLAAERTTKRSKRHLCRSARARKQATLKHLIKYGYCPLTIEELNRWRFVDDEKGYDRSYPTSDAFMQWINLNFEGHDDGRADYTSVYQLRAELMERDFDFDNSEKDRYKLGRALYSMAVRRGFKSSKDNKAGDEETDGEQSSATSEDKRSSKLKQLMAEHQFVTIGQAFYYLEMEGSFAEGERGFRVRNSEYTAIRSQYLDEVKAIFHTQGLDPDSDFCRGILSCKKNEGTIFYKRPLQGQKGSIGKCFLEPQKPRCYLSHPEFEEFRALQLINNIRIKLSTECDWIALNDEQRKQLYEEKFLNSSREYFKFREIREALEKMLGATFSKQAGTINYRDDSSVSGCPVTVRLNRLFEGKAFNDKLSSGYTVEDVWHICVCNSTEDEEWLKRFAGEKLHLDEAKVKALVTLWNNLPEGYSNLSLKAIRRINVMMRQGMGYADAVMFAKVPDIIGEEHYAEVADSIMDIADHFAAKYNALRDEIRIENAKLETYISEHPEEDFGHAVGKFKTMPNKMDLFKRFMHTTFPEVKAHLWERLYHHSDVSFYPVPPRDKDGNMYLADPVKGRILPPSVKHALCILRKRMNGLIKSGFVDPDNSRIVIETAREMCDANMKWAIDTYNARRENENKEIVKLIQEVCEGYKDKSVSDEEVDTARLLLEQGDRQNESLEDEGRYYDMKVKAERYKLWKEQNYMCIYTGRFIPLSSLFTEDYDIDHTLPISQSFDDSLENKTICDAHYNRKIKKNLLPTQLPGYEEKIRYSPVLDLWAKKVDRLKRQVDVWDKKAKRAAEPERKNEALRQKYVYRMELNYWEGKLNRFYVTEIDDKFRNSQLNDTRIMTRYALHYLKSVFVKVFVQRGETTAKFRTILGIEKKDRSKHYHHAIDALVLSVIPHAKLRDEILETYYKIQESKRYGTRKEEDDLNGKLRHKLMLAGISIREVKDAVEKIKAELIIDHEKKDNKLVRNNKRKRVRGKIVEGEWMRGDVAKGQLHLDTLYGAIKLPGESVQYVTRKPLTSVKNVQEIVDPMVRKAIEYQMKQYGIKNLSSCDGKPMWMMRWETDANGNEIGIIVKEDKNGRPLLPIRHVRVKISKTQHTKIVQIKKNERKSQKKLVNLQDRVHKESQYAEKGSNVCCIIYRAIDSNQNDQFFYRFINDFELATDKRVYRQLANKTSSQKEFLYLLDKYQYQFHTFEVGRGAKKHDETLECSIYKIVTIGDVLRLRSKKALTAALKSESTYIVRGFCYQHLPKGDIYVTHHLEADVEHNKIYIGPTSIEKYDIIE